MKDPEFQPDWTSFPGETIADFLCERGLSESDFAEKMALTSDEVKSLLQGQLPITTLVANRLAQVLGPSVEYWMAREYQYQKDQKRLEK